MRREEELIKLAIYTSLYKNLYFEENKVKFNGELYRLRSIDDLVNVLGIVIDDANDIISLHTERIEALEEELAEQKDYILYMQNQLYDNGLEPNDY